MIAKAINSDGEEEIFKRGKEGNYGNPAQVQSGQRAGAVYPVYGYIEEHY
ncbi:hypothetical protein [Endozoicomonas sp.]|nr:hypothetical protein [Endozoicomonas sp.]